jgi:hypothetical protein
MSFYIVLEAKYIRNWKNETRCWTHYPVRDKKIVKFGVFRPWSLGMRSANAPHLPPTPATPPLTPPPLLCPMQLTVPFPNRSPPPLMSDGRILGRRTQKWLSKNSCSLGNLQPRKWPNSKFHNCGLILTIISKNWLNNLYK